jgi:hypothetical protein
MRHSNRLRWAIALLAIGVFATGLLADSPATQPADDSPQKFAEGLTNDKVAAMTVDQAMQILDYDPTSDKEKADAKLVAANSITVSKLELAARDKWGKDGEVAVTHALEDNTPDDLVHADWADDGVHAVAQFKGDLSPMVLIKKAGQWKIDLAGSRKLAHADLDDDLKVEQQASAILDQLAKDIADKNTYPTADAFAQHAKDAMAKLGDPGCID